ncbi:thioesterase [Janthinobacterium sp. ROICE36]|uniref:thioesterase II family protein n=1 Tax=Janthinobacterium sp. ROICE36 TaxID=2048670 RepID=UPI000C7EE88C|nr:alpha/beta fold hydrolase [Janthinobacterium sp. ROICE36]PLY40168.1 thioesterase [Janthinobacterium sp. ROICE36]
MKQTPWLVGTRLPTRNLRLYCFSYAGGGAHAYTPWQRALGPNIELSAIQMPGRGARMGEPPVESMTQLVETLVDVIVSDADMPYAFFGHSLGGLIAFEVARCLARQRKTMPQRLIVSGCAAPQHRNQSRQLHRLSDDALIQALADYNGTPPEILANQELMALLLPMIRADFGLAERYAYLAGPSLDIPISVFAGTEDQHVSSAGKWAEESSVTCRVHSFEGDHFFIHTRRDAVVACLKRELESDILSLPWKTNATAFLRIGKCEGSAPGHPPLVSVG